MKKLVLSFLFLVLADGFVHAQKADLLVKSSDKGLYLEHKVVAKESFYSVGRLYNVSPRSIASFNKLDMNKGLFIDQKIRIPLSDTNFTQNGNKGTPVYYKAKEKDDLSKISAGNKNVSITNLKWWNNLTGDNVKEGTKLIIGFLMSKEMPSVTINNKPKPEEPVVKVEEPVLTKNEKKEEKKEAEAEIKAEKKEEKKEPPPVIPEEKKPVIQGQGYFKNDFEKQIRITPASKDETVTSGIFRTTSGWQDAKFYLLIDKVPPGTIVKVINPGNNKAVYAKVLGEMSGIRQNEGLNIRISNAAASALEITEQDKFIVKVNYVP
ncbi:MAG TPA: LysM peptidoglycan-binding domain-containing protein [Chitinophagaceae bacterium]